jgi:hypothetical protein
MRQTASAIRTATHRPATHAVRASAPFLANALRRIATTLLLLLSFAAFVPAAHAQAPIDLGLTYTQMRTKFVGAASTDNFYMRGATVDVAYSPFHGIGPVVSLNGMAVTNLRTEIDIHQASFLFGGRYTYSFGHVSPTVWSRRASIFGEGLVGITHASDGLYPTGPLGPKTNTLTSTATGFTYAFGGGVNYNLYHRFELRVMAHYFVTELPNGGTNQQKDTQVSAGVNWHFGN